MDYLTLKVSLPSFMENFETFGVLFEALCERNLRPVLRWGTLSLPRLQNREIDTVIKLPNGQRCAFEIKLGANQIDTAAEKLLAINTRWRKNPGVSRQKSCVLFAA